MDLLEIRLNVGARLSNRDLASCVRVSKLWHQTFLPILYSTSNFTADEEAWTSFQPHLHYIRELTIYTEGTTADYDSLLSHCRLLSTVQLTFHGDEDEEGDEKDWEQEERLFYLQLLQQNQQLRQILLNGPLNPRSGAEVLATVALHCQRVVDLDLYRCSLTGDVLSKFLEIAPRLTKLDLCQCWPNRIQAGDFWDNDEEMSSSPLPEFSALRELIVIVGGLGALSWKNVVQLFANSPRLEMMSWYGFGPNDVDTFVSKLCSTLRGRLDQDDGHEGSVEGKWLHHERPAGSWPKLHSLGIMGLSGIYRSHFSDDLFAELLECCPNNLKTLTVPEVTIGPQAAEALQRHLGSLEVLHIPTSSSLTQEILSTCTQLQEFRGGELYAHEVMDIQSSGFRDKPIVLPSFSSSLSPSTASSLPRPWVCHKIRVLDMTLVRMPEDDANRFVFERLAQLKYLRFLGLCSFPVEGLEGLTPKIIAQCLGLNKNDALWNRGGAFNFFNEGSQANLIQRWPWLQSLLEVWPVMDHCCLGA